MSEPEFPTKRLVAAGATPAEVDELLGIFERSDVTMRSAMVDAYAEVSDRGLAELLAEMRASGRLGSGGGDTETGANAPEAPSRAPVVESTETEAPEAETDGEDVEADADEVEPE